MKKMLGAVLIGVLFAAAPVAAAYASEQKFDGSLYYLKGNLWAIQELKGNIDGNNFEDTVTLVVERNESNGMDERMWFEVRPGYDPKTPVERRPKPFVAALPADVKGYNTRMELTNFIPGEREQVFLTFDASPSGPRYFEVVQIRAEDVRKDAKFLFDSRTMARAIISGEFIGKFRATIHVDDTKTNALLDLSGKKDFYVKEKVYDNSGKLYRPVNLRAKRYDDISLGERDAQGVTQLNATIELFGANDEDHVATVNCVMKYDPPFGSWKVMESQVVPAANIVFVPARER